MFKSFVEGRLTPPGLIRIKSMVPMVNTPLKPAKEVLVRWFQQVMRVGSQSPSITPAVMNHLRILTGFSSSQGVITRKSNVARRLVARTPRPDILRRLSSR